MEALKKILKYYNNYKKTADLWERTNIVLGKKPIFKVSIGSTLNCEINHYGVSSTTEQEFESLNPPSKYAQ